MAPSWGSSRSRRAPGGGARAAALTVLVLAVTALVPVTEASRDTAAPACVSLPNGVSGGSVALATLGRRLDAVAALNRVDRDALRRVLETDPTARLDGCGRLVYVEPPFVPDDPVLAADPPGPTPEDPPGGVDVFALESAPGSQRTIYLDFTGTRLTDTAWNSYFPAMGADYWMGPYDTDGDPATFGAAERDAVELIWRRVAEDYAPFDVNVTTREPAGEALVRDDADDQVFGTRALITSDPNLSTWCRCGGMAYVGVFDTPSPTDHWDPALVSAGGAGYRYPPKALADIAAHEVGHTLGLGHDGLLDTPDHPGGTGYYRGHGLWAPIMGSAYSRPLGQWSRGEYADANNTEDDLAVIAGHGARPVADDHADGPDGATPVTGDAPVAGVVGVGAGAAGAGGEGVVGAGPDTDWFTFTTLGGAFSAAVTPTAVGGNLDARLTLYGADGGPLETADPPSVQVGEGYGATVEGLGASLDTALVAGTYHLRVEGVGWGDVHGDGYPAYGSLGRYALEVDLPTAPQPVITTRELHGGVLGVPYEQALAAVGGSAPHTWEVTDGAWPAGLSMSPEGVVSGTPTATGTSRVTVRVRDTAGEATSAPFVVGVVQESSRPVVRRLSVASGPRDGGSTLIVTGEGLAAPVTDPAPSPGTAAAPLAGARAASTAAPPGEWVASTVRFGDVPVDPEDVVALSGKALRVVTPAYALPLTKARVAVTVTVGRATKGPRYTYVADGVSVEPDETCAATPETVAEGGASDTNAAVSLTGTGFDAAFTTVAVGGRKLRAGAVGVSSEGTRLTFTPPKKLTGVQDVVVLDQRVPTGALYAGFCTYTGIRPTITGVSATRVSAVVATEVTLTGTHLDRVRTATYGGERVRVGRTGGPGTLTVTVPPGSVVAPGVPIVVTTAYEESAASPAITREAGTA